LDASLARLDVLTRLEARGLVEPLRREERAELARLLTKILDTGRMA
jgi:hypothetical protein